MKIPFSEHIWEMISSLGSKSGKPLNKDINDQKAGIRYMMHILFWSRRALKSETKYTYDLQKAWQQVNARISRPRRQLLLWGKYAAVFILSLGIAWYFLASRSGQQSPVAHLGENTIRPGMSRAELLLANGERIFLNAETSVKEIQNLGITLTNHPQDHSLYYTTTHIADSSEAKYNTLCVPKGGEYSLILPDGTQVWLNAETSLRFPVQFARNKREVYLSGEAYFKVRKDTTAPFIVYASEKKITVLGTSFNVSAYPDDKLWQATLVEGRVSIVGADRQVILKPSEQYLSNQTTGAWQVREVDTELYTSWVQGKFYFKAYTFEEIVKKLERWYDFTMIYQSEDIKKMRFTGTINKHRPIGEILQYLEMTTDIRFSVSEKNIVVSKNETKEKG